jgi:hypothetical protein
MALDIRAEVDAFLSRAVEWEGPPQVLWVSPETLALYERVLAGRQCPDCPSTIMPDEVHIRVTNRVLDVCVPFTVPSAA